MVCLLLLASGLTLYLVHVYLRFYPRPWYFVVTAHALSIGLALFWARAGRVLRWICALVAIPILIICNMLSWQAGYYPWQDGFQFAAAQWARENTPEDAVLGSMNGGIIGY